MLRATISADIIASSSLSGKELEELTTFSYSLFDKINTFQQRNKQEKITFRLISGDLIECVILNPNDALRTALALKAGIKTFPLDKKGKYTPTVKKSRKLFETYGIRVAIGIGDMDLELLGKDIFKGNAINLSGRLIASQKTSNKERVTVKNSLFFSSVVESQNQLFQTMLSLLDIIFSKMTRKQSEIIFQKILGYSEHEIAQALGVSQSSVNQHSKSAGWGAIEEALTLFASFDFQN